MASLSNLFLTSPLHLSRALAVVLIAATGACTADMNLTTAGESLTDGSETADPSEGTTEGETEGTTEGATEGATEGTEGATEGTEGATEGTEGATDSTTDDTTDSTTESPDPTEGPVDPTEGGSDYEQMDACGLPVVCEPFTHLFAEGEPYHSEAEPLLPGETCIWTGLRDGTPGRYTYETDHVFSNGYEDVTYVVHVHADRKVTFATKFRFVIDDDNFDDAGFTLAKTCTLADPAFFDDCLQTPEADSDHYYCAWTDKWWVDCVEEGPKCE